ncbi:hypothetical protein [Lentzea aerocolonigenes]|uniref:hypothetical protein n=1 Tax=Lentzea aerocolonigenes TaxID=68170 RepID=UPI0005ECDFD8|nr:hypothetical protein [Lentzea aerocolonigenes]
MSDHRAGHDRLSDLLAAATAPARDHELAGEQAAVTAFLAARPTAAPQPRRPRMLSLLSVKIAATAAAAAGGIALAAAAGALPGQQREEPAPTAGTKVVSTSTTTKPANPGTPDRKPDNSASPSPSLKGLCQAYSSGAGAEHGKARENPAFSALVTAAGGADRVPAFCAGLLADKPGNTDKGDKPEKPDTPGNPDHTPGKPTR